jgi:two-component system cell cycle sensor histidine kinase PleC
VKRKTTTKRQLLPEMEELRTKLDAAERRLQEANELLQAQIAERKRTEETFEKAQEYTDGIMETIREPLLVLASDLRVLSANRSFYDTFKVTLKETTGNLIYNLGNRQWDIPGLRTLLEDILTKNNKFDNYEVEHVFSDIGHKIMLLNARRIIQKEIGSQMILLAIEDITERRQTEEKLRQSEEYFKEITENSSDVIITTDKNGDIKYCSRSIERFSGYKPEELIGRSGFMFIHPDDVERAIDDFGKAILAVDTAIPNEFRLVLKDGSSRYFAGLGKNLLDNPAVAGFIMNIRDITERREIEIGLEKTRKELEIIKKTADEASEFAESVINTVREPLISLDQDLRVVTVSRSFYEFFKVKPEETVGQLIYDLGNKQWNIPKLRELLETILPQKATFDNYEVEHDFATIGRRIMLLNARQIQRVLGKERIILLAIEDITERREIEIGLEKAHEELKELAAELKRTARVKSEFLANMSHELRTPLNSINGFSEVLYDETFGPLNEKQKKYVNNVLTSGKHLLLLINQILDMAKVEAGKMRLALSSLPMKSLLNEISLLVEDTVSKKKLQMLLEIAEDLPNIEADELKVKEIIYNLLSNAVKFTPEGGKIGMRASTRKADSEIEVVVWDTGIGIAPENMEKVFEGFFRVDTPYSRVTEGTGLGLPLSKKLVELHGGKFSIESKGLNRGTSVRFTLPIVSRKVV